MNEVRGDSKVLAISRTAHHLSMNQSKWTTRKRIHTKQKNDDDD